MTIKYPNGEYQENQVSQKDQDDGTDKAEDEIIVSSEPAVVGSAVAKRIHHSRDSNDEEGHKISDEIIRLDAGFVGLEDFYKHDVELESFKQHPHKCAEEEIVE